MAIMIEAAELYTITNAPQALRLTAEDIDDYSKLHGREAANDAALAYNIHTEQDWKLMHRMAGRTDFANYNPPDRRPTFESGLALVKRKDVDAGQRYLNMVGQTVLVDKLEDYVGCAFAGTYKFKHPVEQQGSDRASSHYLLTPESTADSDPGNNISFASTDKEDAVRDGRQRSICATGSVVSNSVPDAQGKAIDSRALPVSSTTVATAQAPAATAAADHGSNSAKHSLDSTPLLAQPPRRRRVVQGRPAQLKLPQHPSYAVLENQQPDRELKPGPVRAETPPPSVEELVRDMSSRTRRNMSRPDDEPENARNVTSSPLHMTEPRRPRVAHLDRPGQNPTRHSSGSGSPMVRTNLKMQRQLSGVYRPERQWAEQPHSSSPLRVTTPGPATPRSGSKEYFLSEQRPDHPLSSPRLFDESGKTNRERPQSPEGVQKIFRLQEEEAKRQRQTQLEKILPGEPKPSALPSSTTSLGFQAPLPSAVKVSVQQAAQDTAQQQVTIRHPGPILPPPSITRGNHQRPFANQMKSKQVSVQDPSELSPVTPRQTEPILPPPHSAIAEYRAPYQSHVIPDIRSSQVGGLTWTSASANCQSVQTLPNTASLSTPALNRPPPQQPTAQTASQQPSRKQGPHPVGQPPKVQRPAGHRPQVLGSTNHAAVPRQKARRSKTTTAPPESTTGSLSNVRFNSGEKPRGQRPEVLGSEMKAPAPMQKARRTKTPPAPPEPTTGRLSPVKFTSGEKPLPSAKLKSTYKPPAQTLPVERQIYKPPHAREQSSSQVMGSYQTPPSVSTNPQLSRHEAHPNTLKRAHSMLPGMEHGTLMAGPQLPSPHLAGSSFYNDEFPAHTQATYDRTVQEFTRDPPRGHYANQFTKTKAANPLQGPQNFSAPSRGPKDGTPNSSGAATTQPNPFRNGRSSSQASPAASPARPPPAGHAAQYYAPQPQQPRQLQQPYQPHGTPAKKQKVIHEAQGSPERPLWDCNNRISSPAQPSPMMGPFAKTVIISNNGRDTVPQPKMPNPIGPTGVPVSDEFALAMKNHGVQLPGQLAQQAFGNRKRNVGAKVQSCLQNFPPQAPPPQAAMMMGEFGSTMNYQTYAGSFASGPIAFLSSRRCLANIIRRREEE